MAKKTPGLNTSSMADISFLLLTFFLMTSSINTDMGIARRLPPPLPPNQDKPPEIRERNIFVVYINYADAVLYGVGNDKSGTDIRNLREDVKAFFSKPEAEGGPQVEMVKIDGFGKEGEMYPVSKGVISLRNDRGTSYDTYLWVQNELAAAINELRSELSVTKFGKTYVDLSETQREAIDKAIPVAISEAEPKDNSKK